MTRCATSAGVFVFFLVMLLGVPASASEGLDAVSDGDLAHFQGDAQEAKAAYRRAVASGEPAAEAMGRLRLLSYSGNWGAWIHGPAIDRALSRAQGESAQLAWIDFHLFAPTFVGASREEAVRLSKEIYESYPAEAAARIFLATRDEAWLSRLRELPHRDGMGEAFVRQNGQIPPPPGTWNFGFGFSGAPGLGIGAGLSFRHADLRGLATELWLGGSTLGSGYAVIRAHSLSSVFGRIDSGFMRGLLYDYASGSRETIWRNAQWVELGPGIRFDRGRLWVGGKFRKDDVGAGFQEGHGVTAGASFDTRSGWGEHKRGSYLAASGEAVLWGDEAHSSLFVDARGYFGALGGVLAIRGTHQQAFNPEVSFFRLPTVGGMTLHRGAPYQRWRAAWISTLDVEQRWMIWGPIEGVIMGNLAQVSENGLHPAGGVGLRLLLPPEESNVSRVDLAFSDTGWGLYAAWGEAF